MKDYYQTLGLSRDATAIDVKKAYRRLAVQWHPEKNADNKEAAQRKFNELAEAFEVLSDAHRRAIFDQFGEEGLKNGVPDGKGSFSVGWKFSGQSEQIFVKFFGSENPFADVFSEYGAYGSAHPFQPNLREPKKVPSVPIPFYCTLEELYSGCTKKVKISRKRVSPSGASTVEEKVLSIDVRPGFKAGTKITFPGEGDQEAGAQAADIIFVLEERPHDAFVRKGNDLLYTAVVSLSDALTGVAVQINTLDSRILSIPIAEIIHPGFQKVVPGEGMPLSKAPQQRGDLIISFKVDFPRDLSIAQKKELRKILS